MLLVPVPWVPGITLGLTPGPGPHAPATPVARATSSLPPQSDQPLDFWETLPTCSCSHRSWSVTQVTEARLAWGCPLTIPMEFPGLGVAGITHSPGHPRVNGRNYCMVAEATSPASTQLHPVAGCGVVPQACSHRLCTQWASWELRARPPARGTMLGTQSRRTSRGLRRLGQPCQVPWRSSRRHHLLRAGPTWRLLPSSCWLRGFRPHLSCGHPLAFRPPALLAWLPTIPHQLP